MKKLWLDILQNFQTWLTIFFVFPLIGLLLSFIEKNDFSIQFGGQALDHVGGSTFWYQYFYWLLLNHRRCFVLATIVWVVYKVIELLRIKYKNQSIQNEL